MPINKIHNDYAAALGCVFEDAPKAVIAAVAVSLLTNGGDDDFDDLADRFIAEWDTLHVNGIVPQKPAKKSDRRGRPRW